MKITSVVPFDESLLINVDANVPAYKANAETGAMEQTEDTSFSISYSNLARQIYPLCPIVATYRGIVGQHISGDAWVIILSGATINVDFKFAKEGDNVDGYIVENTGYQKTIKSVKLSDTAMQLLMTKLSSSL